MSDHLTPEELAELIPSRSSLLKKVPLETRRLLNRAIIYRNPVTYEGIFNKFKLESLGVSYTAFYYYARRIHLAITTSELSKLRGDPHELLSAAVAQTTLDVAAEPILTAKHLANMARAYRDIEMARAVRIRTKLAEKSEETWLAREDVRHRNRLELKAITLSDRLTLEDRKAQHKKELADLKSQLSAAKPPLPSRGEASRPNAAPKEEAAGRAGVRVEPRADAAPKEEAAGRAEPNQNPQQSRQRPSSSLPITNSQLPIPSSSPSSLQPQVEDPPRRASSLSQSDPAPYGRDPETNRPYTKREYMINFRRANYDIWGIDMAGEGDPNYRALNPDTYEHLIDEDGDLMKIPYHDYVDFDRDGLNEDGLPYRLPPRRNTSIRGAKVQDIVVPGEEKRRARAEAEAKRHPSEPRAGSEPRIEESPGRPPSSGPALLQSRNPSIPQSLARSPDLNARGDPNE